MTIKPTTNSTEFQQIIDLQNRNLEPSISENEVMSEGFVSAQHTVSLLEKMNVPYPHIIATSENKVVGFTLVMLRSMQETIPLLVPLFTTINSISYKGQLLKDASYFVMGQVCIDKPFRGQGLFRKLYDALQSQMQPHFQYCLTGISKRNVRSINAHLGVGFEVVGGYTDDKGDWVIVLLEFN